jgi:hypothetical protein
MKHVIYEDRITHEFAVIRLPPGFVEGDKLPVPPSTRWFATRDEALATLASLFEQEEDAPPERHLH